MLEAITYQEMLRNIKNNEIENDTIGILITRPDLECGRNILNSLNYYHHASGNNINFYLPGYGAYWGENYPDKQIVTTIDGIKWAYSDQMFVKFVEDLEKYSKWKYSGESELLMLEYQNGKLNFDAVMCFRLDNMLQDKVINSVSSFFQRLFRIADNGRPLEQIRNTFGKQQFIQMSKLIIKDNIPEVWQDIVTQEKYFFVKNYRR